MARSMGGSRGGGSRGGGGRSMGGGSRSGSRSFSGSGRSRGSVSSGPRRMSGSSGGYGGGYSSSHHHHHHHHGHHMPPPPRRRYYYSGGRRYYSRSSGGGCASILAYLIVFGIILIALFSSSVGNSGGSSNVKLNREKYKGHVDSSQGYFEDTCVEKFIDRSNEQTLISGFKEFYNKTGVFPFLYVVENTPAKSEYKGYDTYQDYVYDQLFESEGNFLIVYIAQEDDYYFAAGYDTGEIIDETSLDLICDKVNGYWYTGDLAKAFGNGLEDAAKNIMAKSNGRVIGVVIVIAIAAIVLVAMLIKFWKAKKAQDNKEQEDLERILNTPLDTFGSDINDLAQKYDE